MLRPDAPEVDTQDAAEAVDGGALLVDVREPDEFAAIRVPEAQNIPLGSILHRRGELPVDARVYVICAVGGRSLTAAAALRQVGIDAVSVAGGTQRWALEGRPTASGSPELSEP